MKPFLFPASIFLKFIFLRKYQKEESGIKLEGNGKKAWRKDCVYCYILIRHFKNICIFYWNIVDLQCFRCRVRWFNYTYQFSSVTQSCLILCDPINRSTPGLPVYHQLPEFTQTHVHRVRDAIQPPHPLSSPSPPAPNPSQHQSLFQWVNSSHEVAKVLEFQL